MEVNYKGRQVEIEIDGIDTKDWPDLCDARACAGFYTDNLQDLTDEELDDLNDECSAEVNELARESTYG